jgi:hypothetical protein
MSFLCHEEHLRRIQAAKLKEIELEERIGDKLQDRTAPNVEAVGSSKLEDAEALRGGRT